MSKVLSIPSGNSKTPILGEMAQLQLVKNLLKKCIFQDKLIRQLEKESSSNAQDGGVDGDQKAKVAPWRFGPAQLWYDRMGIDETGENFDYGFRLKSVSTWYCN